MHMDSVAPNIAIGDRVDVSALDFASGNLHAKSASSLHVVGTKWEMDGWSRWCKRHVKGHFQIVDIRHDLRLYVLERIA